MTAFHRANNGDERKPLSPWWFPEQRTLCVLDNPHQPVKAQPPQMQSDQPWSWLWRDSAMAKHKPIVEQLVEIGKVFVQNITPAPAPSHFL
jgi:hypothetical protein